MSELKRIMAKCVGGGPLDNLYFSVAKDQEEIVGFTDMTDEDKYIKDESTARDFIGEEAGLAGVSFDHDLKGYCEFRYSSGTS